ncbi:MAG: hypothetical protein LC799_16700 [Actinobacteria bacterium]|nr:hypothetical protein [Actinomycetota bacterium]
MTGPRSAARDSRLNGFTVADRELYADIADADEAEWPGLLNELPDRALREVQRAVPSTRNTALKPAVERAVRSRPHRGAWPLELDRDTRG